MNATAEQTETPTSAWHAQASKALLEHPSRNSRSLPRMGERNERSSGRLHWVEQVVLELAFAQPRRRGRRRWNRPAPLNPVPPGKGQRMNTLIRWDPFKEMEDLQSRLTKLFGLTPAR